MTTTNETDTPRDAVVQEATNGNGREHIGEPMNATEAIREARELVPVGPQGATPANLAQQVDYAQVMAKAMSAIPKHLRNNVGDCLAVIDLASRSGLSPYMFANKTYIQNDRLCFESQLFHAMAQSSGLLDGDLTVEYEGTGDDLVCIITGRLRGDPKPRVHRSPRLADLHPGRVTKDGKTFVKGSPLWDRKPLVQMFYDTSRDWVRIYAPRAVLGIYAPEEFEEYAPQIIHDAAGIAARLVNVDTSEGVGVNHVDRELKQIAEGAARTGIKETKAKVVAEKKPTAAARKVEEKVQPARGAKERAAAKRDGQAAKPQQTAPEKKAVAPEKKKESLPDPGAGPKPVATPAPVANAKLSKVDEYIAATKKWIEETRNPEDCWTRWDSERDLRDKIGIPVKERNLLAAMISDKKL